MSGLADTIIGNPDETARIPQLRQGIITQVNPLMVRVGAASTSLACRALGSVGANVGDTVSVLVISGDRLVLGKASQATTAPLNLGPNNYGDPYRGLNWGGNYLIMSDGGNTFVSTPSSTGTVFIRSGINGGNELQVKQDGNHGFVGNLGVTGRVTASDFNLTGNNSYYFATYGGGWHMTDSTYIRATGDKHVWLGGGWFGCNGGISVGNNGISYQGYGVDLNTNMRVGDANTGHITTRDGYRVTSNGSYNGWYYNSGLFTQKANGGDRATVGFHPGGSAMNLGMVPNGAYLAVWNLDSGTTAPMYMWDVFLEAIGTNPRRVQDVASWPPPPPPDASAAGRRVTVLERVKRLRVNSFRQRQEHGLLALDDDENVVTHDCATHSCKGHAAKPCALMRNWQQERITLDLDDLVDNLPEVVGYSDDDGEASSISSGGMLAVLLSAIKELDERLDRLEETP